MHILDGFDEELGLDFVQFQMMPVILTFATFELWQFCQHETICVHLLGKKKKKGLGILPYFISYLKQKNFFFNL